jgi:neutral ceramidase
VSLFARFLPGCGTLPAEEQMAYRISAIVTAFFILVLIMQPMTAQSADLKVGVAKVDITPQAPVLLAGYASRKDPSTGVHDPLSVRATIFESNGKRLVLISAEIIGYYQGSFEYLQKAMLERFDLQPSELFLTAIHTHSAPAPTLDREAHPANYAYMESLRAAFLQVTTQAFDSLRPARLGVGTGSSPIAVNRRETRPDGTVRLGRNPNGPADRQVAALRITGADDSLLAVLFNYACHATSLGPQNLEISSDIMGLAAGFAEKMLGPEVRVSAFAGASGDIDPWYRVLPGFHDEPGWIPETTLMGTMLGTEVVHAARAAAPLSEDGTIRSSFMMLELPGKERGQTAATPEATPGTINITAARVGDLAFIGFSCEMLTEIGMAIKAASPFEQTFLITHCNGASGYLPPAHVYKEGGYEVESSPFAPGAADMVVKQALRMLYALKE